MFEQRLHFDNLSLALLANVDVPLIKKMINLWEEQNNSWKDYVFTCNIERFLKPSLLCTSTSRNIIKMTSFPMIQSLLIIVTNGKKTLVDHNKHHHMLHSFLDLHHHMLPKIINVIHYVIDPFCVCVFDYNMH